MRSTRPHLLIVCVVLALVAVPAAVSALTVTSISPAVAYTDSARTHDVYGTGFAVGAQVTLTPSAGGAAIAATGEDWVDFTHLRCTITVPPGAATGLYTVTVSNPRDTNSGSQANAFTVYPRPTVTGMTPASLPPASSFTAHVYGTGFVPGTEVYIRGGTGGTSTIYATSEALFSPTQLNCDFSIPFDAYPGPYDIYVRSHPNLDYLLAGGHVFTVELPEATFITALSPASALTGQALSVDVTGNGFTNGAEVIVQGGPSGGPTQLAATGETLIDGTRVRCTLSVPDDAYIGSYTAYLRNPGGEWVYKSNAFAVVAPIPTVTGISPSSADPGQTLSTVYVSGTGFVAGAEVRLEADDTAFLIDATDEVRVNATTVRCTLAIPANAPPGPYLVFARNPGTSWSDPFNGNFAVRSPTPTVTGISPGMALPGQAMQIVYVTGTGFANGAQVRIKGGTGGTTTVSATGEIWVNATAIRCGITVPFDAWPGPYAVEVMNLYGDWVSRPGAFAVVAPIPTVTGISPNSALVGTTLGTVTVTGTGFANGAEVAIAGGATWVDATGETWVSPTQLRCSLAIPADAHVGPYNCYVRNPGRPDWSFVAGAFTVTAPVPTVTGFSPTGAGVGTSVSTFDVYGTGFARGAEVLLRGGFTTIPATGETWVSPTQVRCSLAIPADAYPGPYNVGVINPGRDQVLTTSAFTVTAPTPTVTGVDPDQGAVGETLLPVCVYGTRFARDAEVEFRGGPGDATTIAMIEGWINSTAISCFVTIPPDAPPGPYDVRVRNAGGEWVSMPDAFTVLAPIPHVEQVVPDSSFPGETLNVTVLGIGFMGGTEIAVYGRNRWIDATSETVVDSTRLRCVLAIPASTVPGSYNVSAWNPGMDYWMGTTDAFSVVAPAPTITAITPNRAAPGETLYDVRVTGTGFANGAVIQVYGGREWDTSFTATGVTFVDSTTFVCSLAVPAGASVGLYDVYIRNPPGFEIADGLQDGFTVTAPALPVVAVPPSTLLPTDTDGDGLYDDVNGNGRVDFADVVLYFNRMTWISANEPVSAFDYNVNGRIDFADVVRLFNRL